jgi:hypothetical protein
MSVGEGDAARQLHKLTIGEYKIRPPWLHVEEYSV